MEFERMTERKNLSVESYNPIRLSCNQCRSIWSPQLRANGRLPKYYWKCPKGCNEKERKATIFDIIDFRQYLQLCKTEALAELLITKGLITKEEYSEAINEAEDYTTKNYNRMQEASD